MSTEPIAKLWKPVINVTDLDEGERFWGAVSGLSVKGRNFGQFSVLDRDDATDDSVWILLQLVPDERSCGPGGTHVDFRVDDVRTAVDRIRHLGGRVIRPPDLYPSEEAAVLEWAVMSDPFGNEFCLVEWPLDHTT